ncbi:MAG: hypothetical protein QOG44_843 [Acidimicrobiaceae bacterium]|nr:hypothetical protein [Acidimicrobiaceae bacterium]
MAPEAITAIALPPEPLAATPLAPAPADGAPPPVPAARRVADPDWPPNESPDAPPELPVMQTTVRAARMLTRWMMQLPLRPVVTRVVALPPTPLAATPASVLPAGPSDGEPATLPWPGEPPDALASTAPTMPGVQLTDRAAAELEVLSAQLPWVPGVATQVEVPTPAGAELAEPGAATAAPAEPPPGGGMTVTSPESPPLPIPMTLPESPVVHVTVSALIRSVTLMTQSPVAPEVGPATPGPPGPLAAVGGAAPGGAGAFAALAVLADGASPVVAVAGAGAGAGAPAAGAAAGALPGPGALAPDPAPEAAPDALCLDAGVAPGSWERAR